LVFAADMLSALFVCRLLLPFFVPNDALLSRAAILRLGHTRLAAVLAAHILTAL